MADRSAETRRALIADRPHRAVFVWTMIVGLVLSGLAFAYKVAEFIFTMSAPEAKGFADVPVTIYFIVAAGWLCLLAWCVMTGKFKDLERTKFELLELEEEYERAERNPFSR